MVSFNKVLVGGNLTRDVELRHLQNGMAVTTLGLASNRRYKSNGETKEDTVFLDVEVWGKQAELCAKYLTKGRNIFVEGRLKYDSWEDAGKKRSKLLITAENVQFLDSGKKSQETEEQQSESPSDETTPF